MKKLVGGGILKKSQREQQPNQMPKHMIHVNSDSRTLECREQSRRPWRSISREGDSTEKTHAVPLCGGTGDCGTARVEG